MEIIFDIIVAVCDEKEHNEIMLKLLERTRQVNVKVNAARLQYKVREVKCMENIFLEQH